MRVLILPGDHEVLGGDKMSMGVQNEICKAPLAILPRNAMSRDVL